MAKYLKERKFNEDDGAMDFQVLVALGKQWMQIDDIIAWFKKNQQEGESVSYHMLIKALIQMKNDNS